ncbi:outer membrane protein/protective antigen [Nonlabens sp. YIK11]|uniref:metallophosphoesterase n=1 Tax=Nonlabens sp. YIK11 TaxID=1453349 RepID=UPI0006DC8808|nr:metallophosphoesterase [Nonlabens sp. YIK11]KQC33504.1 outer membrane protein/protective antigen [Nonlabens sp. YIK11]
MTASLRSIILVVLTATIVGSCAKRAIQTRGTATLSTSNEEYRSFYLLGNLGVNQAQDPSVFDQMVNHIADQSQPQDYVLVLGDNVDAESLRKKDEDSKDKEQLNKQLNLLADKKLNVLVLPGDEDWNDEGISGLTNIEELTEELLDDDEAFQPENACPIEEVDISDSMHLIVVDSEWYIENWDKNPKFNDECEIKTREKFIKVLADAVRKARHKTVILAMHHPLYTNGVHGGTLGLRMLSTPKQENAYLPGVGFLYSFVRSQAGLYPQDRYNPLMNELMEEIETIGSGIDRLIVVSAHEESLQYMDHDNIKQIISGAVTATNVASLGKKGKFSAGKLGFAELRVFQDQSSQVFFHIVNENGDLEQVYAADLFEPKEDYDIASLPAVTAKTVKASVYPKEETEVDQDYEEFYGKHYRRLYGLDVEAPVVLLDTLYGGLKVERAGGGNQTQGLRLVDSLDREFNMRALEKDALQFLKSAGYDKLDADKYFAETLPQKLIRDFYTAAHPYGAFAVPRLAGAIKLSHTHPKLFYVPKQPVLGNFNETHGDRLYMIVEKPDDSFDNAHMFGYNEDVESTDDLFEKIRSDEEYTVDEELYIRARIFDMLLGDWDRHEDQWRWAEIKVDEDHSKFEAIPRDRDQVFARFDGKLLEFMNGAIGSTKQFGNYGPDIEYIKQFSRSAIHLDRAVLQRSSMEDWEKQVQFIQDNITPEVVEKAFNEMPEEVKDEQWLQTQQDLLSRKRNLNSIVQRYYKHFLEFQTLKGTDKDDRFTIDRANGKTTINAYRIKDGKSEDVLFERTFSDDETEEIWIYGLDDDDEFIVTGDGDSKIRIVIAGGKGKDIYDVKNGKGISIFDYKSEENDLSKASDARNILRDDYEINHYDHRKSPANKSTFSLEMEYNPDDGFRPQLGIEKATIGYDRNPFTIKYGVNVDYRSLTQAAVFDGYWSKANVLGQWNLQVDAGITTNNYTENFFGYGNDSAFDKDTDFDVNRVFLQHQSIGGSIYKMGDYGSSFTFGSQYEGIEVEPNIPEYTNVDNERDDYFKAYFNYEFKSIDDNRFTTRGMWLKGDFSFTDNLANGEHFVGVDPSLTFWNAIDDNRRLIIKSAIAGQLRMGDAPLFYQAARLGGANGLRSFRQERFTGNYALNASVDLRYDAAPIKTRLLPLRLIPYVGIDTGRVWVSRDTVSTFHTSYGGGIELAFPGLIKGSISYFTGEEGGRLAFGIYLSK